MGYSIRTEKWRYTEWDGGERGAELYDEPDDPGETKNLAADPKYQSVVADMRGRLRSLSGLRPNIIWISNEDMSPRLGAYGDRIARTPVLDRLARESVRYTNAFTTAPVCAPSRAAIITGMYQTTLGAQHMRTTEDRVPELPGPYLAVPPFYVKAFPEYLRAAGYFTSNRSKTDYQFGVPFTIWDDLGTNAHWRNRADKSQPFFSVFNIEADAREPDFSVESGAKGQEARDRSRPRSRFRRTTRIRQPCVKSSPACTTTSPTWTARSARFSTQLDEDGLADDTIVFYWSDHGDGVPRAKRSLYDSGLRVPLMIRCRKAIGSTMTPGSVRDELVSFIDLAPTVLALAGVEVPAHLQGRVLVGPGGRAATGVRVRRARPDGHRIRHDALCARRAIPVHPQLRAGAAVRRPHHVSQSERDHAGVAQAAGRKEADRSGGALDANRASSRGAVRHDRPIPTRSATCPRSRRTAQRSRGCAAP